MTLYQQGHGTVAPLISLFLLRLNDLLFIRATSTVGTCCTTNP